MLLIRNRAERMKCAAIGTATITCASGVIDQRMHQHYASHAVKAAQQSTTQCILPAKSLTDQAIAELQMWAKLYKQGILTGEEFAILTARTLEV